MKVQSMRLLDRWIGLPVSAALTVVRKLEDVIRREPAGAPRRILFIKLVEQGATVVAVPALHRAIEMAGADNIFMIVFAQNRSILDVLDVVPPANVITIRSTGLGVCAIDTIRAIRRMRREQIDTAVDFEFFSRFSGALTYLSGAKRRIGFHSFAGEAGYRGDLMTHRVAYNLTLHASQIYRVLVEVLTMRPDQLPTIDYKADDEQAEPSFRPGPEEVGEVEALLRNKLGRVSIPPLVLLNANSGDLLPLRRWPGDRYVLLAERLLKRFPHIVIAFTGSPEEQEDAERLVTLVGSERCTSVAGQTTLRQLLVLYGLAEILVTNDSGPAHYASLTPIDVIALFGPETPAVFGPRSPRSHTIWAGIACSPCVNAFNQRVTTCSNNLCMQRISTDEVFAAVCRVYAQRHKVAKLGQFTDQAATAAARISG
ncbi:MAG: glycosyltransferase family 9 protein [Woeseiaceae bacterium]